jgi:hypothetical protein
MAAADTSAMGPPSGPSLRAPSGLEPATNHGLSFAKHAGCFMCGKLIRRESDGRSVDPDRWPWALWTSAASSSGPYSGRAHQSVCWRRAEERRDQLLQEEQAALYAAKATRALELALASGGQRSAAYTACLLGMDLLSTRLASTKLVPLMQQLLAQALMDQRVASLKAEGTDLTRQLVPLAEGACAVFIDEGHKLKCPVQLVQSSRVLEAGMRTAGAVQQHRAACAAADAAEQRRVCPSRQLSACPAPAARGPPHPPAQLPPNAAGRAVPFLSKGVLLAAIAWLEAKWQRLGPREQRKWLNTPETLKRIAMGQTDDQSVSASPELAAALRGMGFDAEAVIMQAALEAFDAMDMRHLSSAVRTGRLHVRTLLVCLLLGNWPFLAVAQPYCPMPGLSRAQAMSWVGNADQRLALLERLRPDQREGVCERSLSTDPCELIFSTLKSVCGGKPPLRVIIGAAQRVAFQSAMRQQLAEALGIVAGTRKRVYSQHGLEGVPGWNEPVLGPRGQALLRRMRRVAAVAAARTRPARKSIRLIHTAKKEGLGKGEL